ncbi:MAG: chemotaxis protein CheW [Rhodospirillaceae bacterium]
MTVVHPEGTALSVTVGERVFALAAGTVRRVGYPGPLTALPFVPDWIEGLTAVDHRPLLQIDPLRALGGAGRSGPADKLVVVATAAGPVALRVNGIEPAAAAAAGSPLPVEALVRHLVPPCAPGGAPPGANAEPAPAATLLVVTGGAGRAGILIDEGLCVGAVAASHRVVNGDENGQVMATVGDRLLPARRLFEQGEAGRAVIGPTAEGWMALLVERLIGLEHIPPDRLVLLPGAAPGRNLCFSAAGGQPVPLFDFESLAAGRGGAGPAYRDLLDRVRDRQRHARPTPPPAAAAADGLILTVRGMRWLLPLALVERMLGADERPEPGGPPPQGRAVVRLFDAGLWFSPAAPPSPAAGRGEAVLLRLSAGRRIALRGDGIALEAGGGDRPWLPPPALPPGLAALVDGVRAEPDSGRWCLRLAAGLSAAVLPLSLRRAAAAAGLGRLAPTEPLETNRQEPPS